MTDYSFPKALILKKSEQFRDIIKNGKSVQSECFVVYYVHEKELKFGFSASAKVTSKPKRNRLKRLAREVIRQTFRRYNPKAEIVIIAKPKALTEDFKNLVREIESVFQIIGKSQGITEDENVRDNGQHEVAH